MPISRATRFAVASGSKAFTALAVMRLVEDGAIALDGRVRPVLGDVLPLVDDGVTVEHLLTHTSGIGDYIDEEGDWDAADYVLPVPVHTLAETEAFVPIVDGYPQASPPGSASRTATVATSCSPWLPSVSAACRSTTWWRERCATGPG